MGNKDSVHSSLFGGTMARMVSDPPVAAVALDRQERKSAPFISDAVGRTGHGLAARLRCDGGDGGDGVQVSR